MLDKASVVVCEVVEERRKALEAEFAVRTSATVAEGCRDAEVVILAIKPQDMKSLSAGTLSNALVISIMAGVPIAAIKQSTGADRVIRVMPNTPAAIGAGMSAWTATAAVDEASRAFAARLLSSMGKDLYVESEAKIDMATAVNGSGPGFVFLLMEAMVEGAVDVGLTRDQAETLVLQTFYGSAKYASVSGGISRRFAPRSRRRQAPPRPACEHLSVMASVPRSPTPCAPPTTGRRNWGN